VKNAPTKEWRTFGKKYLEKSFNTMKKLMGSKMRANKIPIWNGVNI
jgi:hypothetical protein